MFVRVKLNEIDTRIGSSITVNRLVSSKSADWVRKVDNSKRVAIALGYLRKAIDPGSPHCILALLDALPTRPNGPAARALAASSSASAAVPAHGGVLDVASVERMVSSVVVRELQRLQSAYPAPYAAPGMYPPYGPGFARGSAASASADGAADSEAAAGALVPGGGGGGWSWDQPPSPLP